jgi:hypothetical protein
MKSSLYKSYMYIYFHHSKRPSLEKGNRIAQLGVGVMHISDIECNHLKCILGTRLDQLLPNEQYSRLYCLL